MFSHSCTIREILPATHAEASATIRAGTPELITVPSRNRTALPAGCRTCTCIGGCSAPCTFIIHPLPVYIFPMPSIWRNYFSMSIGMLRKNPARRGPAGVDVSSVKSWKDGVLCACPELPGLDWNLSRCQCLAPVTLSE